MALYLLARCALICLLLFPGIALATDTYVSTSGSNVNACGAGRGSPKQSIANAINSCGGAGNRIIMLAGTYDEYLHGYINVSWPNNVTSGNPFVLMGEDGATVIIKPSASTLSCPGCNAGNVVSPAVEIADTTGNFTSSTLKQYYILRNFTIDVSLSPWMGQVALRFDQGTNFFEADHITLIGGYSGTGDVQTDGNGNGIVGGGVVTNPPSATQGHWWHHGEIRNFAAYGMYTSGINGWLIEETYIHDNGGYGIHNYQSGANNNMGPATIRNNRIVNNGDNSFSSATEAASTCGILVSNSSAGHLVYNNVVANQRAASVGDACGIIVSSYKASVFNNTIVGSVGTCLVTSSFSINAVFTNNLCYLNGSNISNSGSGSTFSNNNVTDINPVFVNLVTGDYHLQSTSPMIGAGITQAGVTTDKDGNTRGSVGGASDIGAYEFVTTAGTSKGTFFVATSGGSDGNSCDAAKGTVGSPSASPKATINAALACAASESTIYIRTGTYAEQIDTNTQAIPAGTSWSAPTTIAAYPGESVTLTRNTEGVIIFLRNGASSQYIVFDGLKLDGLNTSGTNGLATYPGVNHIRFQNGQITRTYYEGAFIYSSDNIELLDNVCNATVFLDCIGIYGSSNVTLRGIQGYNNAAAAVSVGSSSSNVTMDRMTLHDNTGNGITIGGIATALISNSLIYDNAVRGIEVQTGASGVKVYNNTIWSNTGTSLQINSGASGTLHTNNIYYQNGTDTPANSGSGTVGTTNVTANPTFVAPGPTTTFHVSGSNVVGVGTVLAEVTTDYAGVGRTAPYNTIGAYEEGAPPVTPPTNAPVSPYASTNFFFFD